MKLSDSASYRYVVPVPPSRTIDVPSAEAIMLERFAVDKGVCAPAALTPVTFVPVRGTALFPITCQSDPGIAVWVGVAGWSMTNSRPLRPSAMV